MMYEFANLDRLVEETLRPDLLRLALVEPAQNVTGTTLPFAAEERKRICDTLYHGYFSASDPAKASHYISIHLKAAATLAETLRQFMISLGDGDNPQMAVIYAGVCSELEGIISYIRKHFQSTFDEETSMPFTLARSLKPLLVTSVERLRLAANSQPEQTALLELIFAPVSNFLEQEYETISFRLFGYYHLLTVQLLSAIDAKSGAGSEAINLVLLSMNFNAPEYIAWCTGGFVSETSKMSIEQQLEKMARSLKGIEQLEMAPAVSLSLQVQPAWINTLFSNGKGIYLLEGVPSATRQLAGWIKKEMEFLEYTRQLEVAEVNGFEKINTGLTIWQLSVFIAVFLETGVFITENEHSYSATIRSVGRIVKTVGQDNLSLESLRTKIYTLRKMENIRSNPPARKALEACMDLFFKCYTVCKKYLG